jgi:hypothetical protein
MKYEIPEYIETFFNGRRIDAAKFWNIESRQFDAWKKGGHYIEVTTDINSIETHTRLKDFDSRKRT